MNHLLKKITRTSILTAAVLVTAFFAPLTGSSFALAGESNEQKIALQGEGLSVSVDIKQTRTIQAPLHKVRQSFTKPEHLLSIYPKLDKASPLEADLSYLHEIKPLGTMGYMHSVKYAAKYVLTAKPDLVVLDWTPLGHTQANSNLTGYLKLEKLSDFETKATLKVSGEISEIQAPAMFSGTAKRVTKKLFEQTMGEFLHSIEKTTLAQANREVLASQSR